MDVSEMRPECCVIGLCVYNNEPGLPSVLSNIVKIVESGLFEKITLVAFYDNSSDNSHSIMEVFKKKYESVCENTFKMIIVVNNSNGRKSVDLENSIQAGAHEADITRPSLTGQNPSA